MTRRRHGETSGAALPPLTHELVERLMQAYCSGYMSGTAATVVSLRDDDVTELTHRAVVEAMRSAERVARRVVDRMWADPLIRDGIERACRAVYAGGPEVHEWGHFVSDAGGS